MSGDGAHSGPARPESIAVRLVRLEAQADRIEAMLAELCGLLVEDELRGMGFD